MKREKEKYKKEDKAVTVWLNDLDIISVIREDILFKSVTTNCQLAVLKRILRNGNSEMRLTSRP